MTPNTVRNKEAKPENKNNFVKNTQLIQEDFDRFMNHNDHSIINNKSAQNLSYSHMEKSELPFKAEFMPYYGQDS